MPANFCKVQIFQAKVKIERNFVEIVRVIESLEEGLGDELESIYFRTLASRPPRLLACLRPTAVILRFDRSSRPNRRGHPASHLPSQYFTPYPMPHALCLKLFPSTLCLAPCAYFSVLSPHHLVLLRYPTLRAEDLANAWAYYRSHKQEIELQIREN